MRSNRTSLDDPLQCIKESPCVIFFWLRLFAGSRGEKDEIYASAAAATAMGLAASVFVIE